MLRIKKKATVAVNEPSNYQSVVF